MIYFTGIPLLQNDMQLQIVISPLTGEEYFFILFKAFSAWFQNQSQNILSEWKNTECITRSEIFLDHYEMTMLNKLKS